ncbi:hypothetical protein BDF19DRAFT_479388 [Syncephalis fuscata]|nr:hypothetical protein BDF19DRAFT_479388 [Syncephalis fuscata]
MSTETPGALSMNSDQNTSTLSAVSALPAPPNTPRMTAHSAQSSVLTIPPPPAYKPPNLPLTLEEKSEQRLESQCDGIVAPINTPNQSMKDDNLPRRNHTISHSSQGRPNNIAKGAVARRNILGIDTATTPKAPARSASLITTAVRQKVALRNKPKAGNINPHTAEIFSPISPDMFDGERVPFGSIADHSPHRVATPPPPPQPVKIHKRAATFETISSGSDHTKSSDNTVVGNPQAHKPGRNVPVKYRNSMSTISDASMAMWADSIDDQYIMTTPAGSNITIQTANQIQILDESSIIASSVDDSANVSDFNIDVYFNDSNGQISFESDADKSFDATPDTSINSTRVRFRGSHQRRSSEQLSGKSIRRLVNIAPRSATPPVILSPGLMDSVTDAVTGIFYEPSLIMDGPVQLNDTKQQLQESWPIPPLPSNQYSQKSNELKHFQKRQKIDSFTTTSTSAPLFNPSAPPRIYPPPRLDSVNRQQIPAAMPVRTFTPPLTANQIGHNEKCDQWLQKAGEVRHVVGQQVTVSNPDRRAQVGQSIHIKARRVRWADGDAPPVPEPPVEEFVPPPRIASLIDDSNDEGLRSKRNSSIASPPEAIPLSAQASLSKKNTHISRRPRAASDAKHVPSQLVTASSATSEERREHNKAHNRRKASEASIIILPDTIQNESKQSQTITTNQRPKKLQPRRLQKSATVSDTADLPLDERSNVPASSRFATPFFTMISDTTLSMTSFATSSHATVSARDGSDRESIVAPPPAPVDERNLEIRLLREVTLEEARADCHASLPKEKLKLKLKRRLKADPMCACCSRVITDPTCTYALDRYWISSHFRCAHCKFSFANGTFVAHGGRAYCPYDYFSLYGQRCHSCHMVIRDGCVRELGHIWHTDCFRCEDCGIPLKKDEFKHINGATYCIRDAFRIERRDLQH